LKNACGSAILYGLKTTKLQDDSAHSSGGIFPIDLDAITLIHAESDTDSDFFILIKIFLKLKRTFNCS